MLLFFRGNEDNYLLLEIVDAGVHAKAFSLEAELDVTYSGVVSDGHWRDVHVLLDQEGLVLILKGPNCDRDGCTVRDAGTNEHIFHPSEEFTNVYVGGAMAGLMELSQSGTGFIGCMEDLKIDSKPILPQAFPEGRSFELGCNKNDWCEHDPCDGQGLCVDLWTSYQCDCFRPFHGKNCSEGKTSHKNLLSR